MSASGPRVQLLWWEGCPSWQEVLGDLKTAMVDLDLDPDAVQVVEIRTDAEAKSEGFPGSPTIRIDGADLQPPGKDEPRGLTCRVYRLRDGRISATPDPEDVRDALRAAVERGDRDAA